MPNETPVPQQIPIEKVIDLPGVTDDNLPEKSYGTLVSSILLNGQREPVILRPLENGEYQLVHGYRRRKAAMLAKKKELTAHVYDMTEKEAQEYRRAVMVDPNAPIPGKLIEKSEKAPAPEKTPSKTKAVPEKKEAATPKKEAEKPAESKADLAASAAKPEEKKAESKAEVKKAEMPKEAPPARTTTLHIRSSAFCFHLSSGTRKFRQAVHIRLL